MPASMTAIAPNAIDQTLPDYSTLLERDCHPVDEERHNEKIMVIKDIAASAVGISILIWFVVCWVEVDGMWSQFTSPP